MSFTIQQPKDQGNKPGLSLVFVDKVQSLNNSLDNLVKNLAKNDFYHLSQELNSNVLNLLKKIRLNWLKIFPYDYSSSFKKWKESLPSKDKFNNTLSSCGISHRNYEHVLNVWKDLKTNTMKDYHDMYLKTDVLLLVCVFKTFRKEWINSFKLDPAHYLSVVGHYLSAVSQGC